MIVATKLHIPRSRTALVARPRLIHRLPRFAWKMTTAASIRLPYDTYGLPAAIRWMNMPIGKPSGKGKRCVMQA